MLIVGQESWKAIARLSSDPDFKLFIESLSSERDRAFEALMTHTNPVLIHQAQGRAATLVEILQTLESAPTAASSRNT